ncbi:MAG TPA: hypothetical protein VH419_06815 [Nocardioidaceae bacterium]
MDDAERLAALLRSLTNITPTAGQVDRIELLRDKAKMFGQAVIESCPDSRERSLALTHLEAAVMWAVKSIMVEGA